MAYLELSPMIAALRDRPTDFEVDRGWLVHFPSRHSFMFDRLGQCRNARALRVRTLIGARRGWTRAVDSLSRVACELLASDRDKSRIRCPLP